MVLIKLAVNRRERWTYAGLAHDLGMSSSEVFAALRRAERSALFSRELRRPRLDNLEEFLLHGVQYAYPPAIGGITRGVPTAGSHPVFLEEFPFSPEEGYVWPYAQGWQRGMSFSPLYKSAPEASQKDKSLYTALALVDALRLGRQREMAFARRKLKEWLHEGGWRDG
jgi:hypothetical protein